MDAEKVDLCTENDETIVVKDMERVEEIIIEGISNTRKSCARPSYQRLLSYINNGKEFNLNMESLKRILEKELIYVKGKRGFESFYVMDNLSDSSKNGEDNNIERS